MSELGNRLSELRQDKQERQKDIADLLHVSAGSISNYETGTHLPTVDALSELATHFGVTTDFLLGRTNCRISIDSINKTFVGSTTYGELIELLSELPPGKRKIILELISDIRVSVYLKSRQKL